MLIVCYSSIIVKRREQECRVDGRYVVKVKPMLVG